MGRIFLVIIAALFLVGCQSIPLPENEGDKLFVISQGKKFKTDDGSGRGSAKIVIQNKKLEYRKTFKVNGEDFILLKNLIPGRYEILNYNNGSASSFTSFIVKEDFNEVTIFKSRINVLYYDFGNHIGSEPLSEEEINNIYSEVILLYPEMEAWNW